MNKYGIHLIPVHNRNEDYEFIGDMQPRIIKIVNPSVGHIDRIRNVLGGAFYGTVFVLRDHLLSEQKEEMARNPRALALEHVERLAEMRIRVGLHNHDNTFVEGINEPNLDAGTRPPINSSGYQGWYEQTRVLSSHSDIYTATLARNSAVIDQRIMGYLFSVGWPANLDEGENPYWGFFEDSLDALEEGRHWVGLHEYWSKDGPEVGAGWWAYRWKHMPRNIPVAITECGLDEYVVDPTVGKPKDRGWKNFLTAMQNTNDHDEYYWENNKDPRFQGHTAFTSDSSDEWQSYDMLDTYPYVLARDWEVTDINGAPEPPVSPLSVALIWPAVGVTTQRFGERYEQYMEWFGAAGHNGVDIANREGTDLLAVADGVVQWADWDEGGYGFYIRIWHEELRLHSFYAHMTKASHLDRGATVKQGDEVGLMGNTGNSTGPHLHFELRAGEQGGYKSVTFGHTKGRFNPEVAYHLLNERDDEE